MLDKNKLSVYGSILGRQAVSAMVPVSDLPVSCCIKTTPVILNKCSACEPICNRRILDSQKLGASVDFRASDVANDRMNKGHHIEVGSLDGLKNFASSEVIC